MKSSNPKVMINAYRLLVARLREEGADWNYPIHLGVTEAGEGEDARIKSAIGIGSLLADGIGDTIRVSLTEDSIHEIPVAKALIETISNSESKCPQARISFDPFSYQRRATARIDCSGVSLGGEELVRVVVRQANYDKIAHKIDKMGDYKPEIVYERFDIPEVDPRDDAAIAQLNANGRAQLVTIRDDVDLPVISAFRLLAAKLQSRHPILLKDIFGKPKKDLDFLQDIADCIDEHRLAALRWNRRCDSRARRGSARASIATLLQYFAGGRVADFQDRLCRVSFVRPDAFQSANHDRADQSRDVASERSEDRDHGLHRERTGGNGGRRLWLRRRRARKGESLCRQDGGKIQYP